MKAWMLDQPGQPLALRDAPQPVARRGALLVGVEAVPLLSYTRQYVEGKLAYGYPPGPFSPGTNGIGRVLAVGEGVYGYREGQCVALSPYWVADEALREPAQALLGLTAISPDSAPMLADFPHGTLREMVEFPASTVFPLDGLDHIPSAQLAALGKLVVPFGGLRRGRLAAGEIVVVNGAAGAFGSAAVLDALALGAGRVVALGRRRRSRFRHGRPRHRSERHARRAAQPAPQRPHGPDGALHVQRRRLPGVDRTRAVGAGAARCDRAGAPSVRGTRDRDRCGGKGRRADVRDGLHVVKRGMSQKTNRPAA